MLGRGIFDEDVRRKPLAVAVDAEFVFFYMEFELRCRRSFALRLLGAARLRSVGASLRRPYFGPKINC